MKIISSSIKKAFGQVLQKQQYFKVWAPKNFVSLIEANLTFFETSVRLLKQWVLFIKTYS